MSDNPVLEVALFKLRDGADEAAFLERSEDIMPYLREREGFVSRELRKSDDGRWLDMVQWRSLTDAQRADEAITPLPAAQRLFELMDESSLIFLHLHPVRRYQSDPVHWGDLGTR